MNKWVGMGRLTRDPEVRYRMEGNEEKLYARFALAVDRRGKGQNNADFFNCVCFGKLAEIVEKHVKKGTKLLITARVQNDVYQNREGQKVYSVQMIVDELEFCESKSAQQTEQQEAPSTGTWMNVPDNEEGLPFN